MTTPNPYLPPDGTQPTSVPPAAPTSGPPPQPTYQPGVAPATEPQGWPARPGQEPTLQQPAVPDYQQPPGYPAYPPAQSADPWAQPAYQQPQAYQQAAYPAYPTAPPPTKSKAPLWIALAVVAVLLIGGGVAAFLAFGGERDDKETTSGTNTPTPSVTTPSATQTSSEPSNPGSSTLVIPASIGDLQTTSNPQLTALADQLKGDIGSAGGGTGVAGVYEDKTDPTKIVLVAGVSDQNTSPPAALTGMLSGFTSQIGGSAADAKEVDPGPKGGVAKCGEATVSGQSVVYCGWADNDSTAIVAFFNHDLAEAKGLFLDVRGAVETG